MRSGGLKLEASSERDGADAFAAWLTSPERRAALVVAHPAHEMRVLQWFSRTRAHAYVLTQGSRSGTDSARREACEYLITSSGGTISSWGGTWDRDLYQHLLQGEAAPFAQWARELAEDFVRRELDLIVIDAWQYYNVAHDLTHLMARMAAERASAELGHRITVIDYPVVPDELAPGAPPSRVRATLELSAAEAEAKQAAISAVADIAGDAAIIEHVEGEALYAREIFREPPPLQHLLKAPAEKPLYELFGEARVQSSIYFNVIRWSHVAPVCTALAEAFEPALA